MVETLQGPRPPLSSQMSTSYSERPLTVLYTLRSLSTPDAEDVSLKEESDLTALAHITMSRNSPVLSPFVWFYPQLLKHTCDLRFTQHGKVMGWLRDADQLLRTM